MIENETGSYGCAFNKESGADFFNAVVDAFAPEEAF
jgi:hypothetical protein